MDWIIGLLLLAVGAVIGFFASKQVNKGESEQNNQELESTIKQVLAQQAAVHIQESRSMIDAIEQQCSQMSQQLNSYEALLQEHNSQYNEQLTFFGDQAAAYLRNKQSKKKATANKTDYQPLDYSAQSSGLFDGTKSEQTETKNS